MTPPRTIRIGLLICGVFPGAIAQVHGDYYSVYRDYWRSTIPSGCNVEVVIEGFYVRNMEFPDEKQLDEFDLLMVTGSFDSAYDDTLPWVKRLVPFVRNLIENHPRVKLAGICFGHQIICRALGGDSIPTEQLELGPTLVNLSDMGRSIFGVDQLSLQEIHRDVVPLQSLFRQLALGHLYPVGSSSTTDNQGIIKFYPSSEGATRTPQNIHILSLQGHPEFSEPILTGVIRQCVTNRSTLIDYWGPKGGSYDDEPSNKEGTGRRWWKTDGVDVVSPVYWKMLGVTPSTEASEFMGKEGTTKVSQRSEALGTSVKVEREGRVVPRGWWRLFNSFRFASNLFRKVMGAVIRQ